MRNIPRLKLKIKTIGNGAKTTINIKGREAGSNELIKEEIKGPRKKVPQKTIQGCLAHHRDDALIALGIILLIRFTPRGWKLRSLGGLFFAALHQLLDTGDQFLSCEWLVNVIVTTTLETLFLVCNGDLCCRS